MRAGGTLDLDALTDDVSQIADGNYATTSLLQLPLDPNFSQDYAQPGTDAGARMDLSVPVTGANPIVGNVVSTRFSLQQPANAIQLIWDCIDSNGNYQVSYPLNSLDNYNPGWAGAGSPSFGQGVIYRTDNISGDDYATAYWARGFIRLNGAGIWFPMSLFPSTENIPPPALSSTATNGGFSNGIISCLSGFSSLAGPISFFDWIGYWDGAGVTDGPNGDNSFILALVTTNLSLSSNRGSNGNLANYAVPNSSGRKQMTVANATTQKRGDILVPQQGGRKGRCD
jgi:hypothetical protein